MRQEQVHAISIAALGMLTAKQASTRMLAPLDDRFRIEEQKLAVATATAVGEPIPDSGCRPRPRHTTLWRGSLERASRR